MRSALAFLSGAVALVYQVVWTREVALLAGSQIQALSVVVAAYFGGLAAGARWFGPWADRSPRPLRLYGGLELLGAALAVACLARLRSVEVLGSTMALLAAAGWAVLLATLPLGGTLPALVRDAAGDARAAARSGGRLLAANTAGAVAGVAAAVLAIPLWGLRSTLTAAVAAGLMVGLVALWRARPAPPAEAAEAPQAARLDVLLAAAALGFAALGFELLATRMAALRLGSSLSAWGLVLGLFLTGLAGGYATLAPRAAMTPRPRRDLGGLAVGAACLLSLGLPVLRPELTRTAAGLTTGSLLRVVLAVLPTTWLMGATFPFLVRLGTGRAIGGGWGAVSAANTAGGIAGALAAPFLLLPALGPVGGAWACAALEATLGLALLARRNSLLAAGLAAGALGLCSLPLLGAPPAPAGTQLLAVFHGSQASAVVTSLRGHRTLIVDGDPEAATVGAARVTEELLAALPLLRHPAPRAFLEIGLGSGITLATATRFPLETLDCVELAPAVRRAAELFAPANAGALSGENVTIHGGDARVFLAEHPRRYDVVAANTLHPWSLGATGLYSREYFTRIARALRGGGVAAQWLPLERIGAESLERILRTFFAVFEHGGVWWGADNLILVGAAAPLAPLDPMQVDARLAEAGLLAARLGLEDGRELAGRRIAGAAAARRALGAGPLLEDDLPALERLASAGDATGIPELLLRIADAGAAEDANAAGARLWLEARAARAAGDPERAERRERLAEAAGFEQARRARAARRVLEGYRELNAGRSAEAAESFRGALREDPLQRDARFGLAGALLRSGALAGAAGELETLVAQHPDDPEAWNELASVRTRQGDAAGARRALQRALGANPFYPEALANAGLLAVARNDLPAARGYLARLTRIDPLGPSPARRALAAAIPPEG